MRTGSPRWSILAVVASAALGCAAAPKPRPADSPPAAAAPTQAPVETAPRAPEGAVTGLVFSVEPAEAQISIDGNARGAVADLADRRGLLPLAPGIYQVSLKATGFVTWRAEVALGSGTETIRVNLARKP